MKELIEKAISAKRQIVDGSYELWNARVELLRNVGDIQGLLELLKDPVELVADNGNCGGCNCGAEQLGAEVARLGIRGKE